MSLQHSVSSWYFPFFSHLFERQSDTEGDKERERGLLSSGSLLKCKKKPRSHEFPPDFPRGRGVRGTITWSLICCLAGHMFKMLGWKQVAGMPMAFQCGVKMFQMAALPTSHNVHPFIFDVNNTMHKSHFLIKLNLLPQGKRIAS